MTQANIHYRVLELCEDSYFAAPEGPCANDLWSTAIRCAEDFYSNHDGWDGWGPDEAHTFTFHDGENGPELGRYAVVWEPSVDFSASKIQHHA